MLWKSANCEGPPQESTDIILFGWELREGIPVPVIAESDPALPELLDVIRCHCKTRSKKCSSETCSCHKQHLSCTSYCNCFAGDDCLNPYTNLREYEAAEEEENNIDDINNNALYDNDEGMEEEIKERGEDEEIYADHSDSEWIQVDFVQ